MIDAEKGPWKYLVMWLRFYYAIHFLKSGHNYAVFGVILDFSKACAVVRHEHVLDQYVLLPVPAPARFMAEAKGSLNQ